MKKILTIFLFILVLFTVSSVSASDLNNGTVPDDSFTSLSEIINSSSGTLDLDKDYIYYSDYDSNITQGIVINKNITIDGKGHTISGNNLVTIFNIQAEYVVFNNCKFINGNASAFDPLKGTYSGGVLYSENYTIFIGDNNIFANNVAKSFGAVVYGFEISVGNNNIFINNTAMTGVLFAMLNINISNNNSFINNILKGLGSVYSEFEDIVVGDYNKFINNSAESGAAIYSKQNIILGNYNIIINNTNSYLGTVCSKMDISVGDYNIFENNYAYDGAAIYAENNILSGSFNYFNSNSALYFGGAISGKNEVKIFNNNVFINNRQTSNAHPQYKGGAIYAGSILNIGDNNKFISNSAYRGGAVASSHNAFIGNNNTFYQNVVVNDGGAMLIISQVYIGSYNNFSSNQALYSGAIDSMKVYLDNYNIFYKNVAFDNGGAINGVNLIDMKDNNIFIENSAAYGGALFTGTAIMNKNNGFIGNVAKRIHGGAIHSANEARIGDNCYFINNSALRGNGGAIEASYIYANNSLFENNFAINGTTFYAANLTINNCFADGNAYIDRYVNSPSQLALYSYYNETSNKYELYGVLTVDNCRIVLYQVLKKYELVGFNLTDNKGNLYTFNHTDGNGIYYFNVPSLPYGNYTFENTVIKQLTNVTITGQLEIKGLNLEVKDVVLYYKNGTQLIAILTYNGDPLENEILVININGKNYTRVTDENGQIAMDLNLNPGVYKIMTSFNDIIYTNSTVTVLSTLNGKDLVKYYKNESSFDVKVFDKQGNPAINQTIRFNINGVFYTKTTNLEGIASLKINLKQGEYIITSENLANGEKISNNITVLPILINNEDLIMYYKNGSSYSVKVVDGQGKAIANATVKFNINGVFYEKLTNVEGIASLKINLNPGNYTITAIYNGCMVSNLVNVLPTISGEDIIMHYKDGTAYTCKVVNGTGQPLEGVKVTFNINGVFYNKLSDSDGLAKLTINLNPGEYIITSDYNGTLTSNKIKILP